MSYLVFIWLNTSDKVKLAVLTWRRNPLFCLFGFFWIFVQFKKRFRQLYHQVLHLIWKLSPNRFLSSKLLFSCWGFLSFLCWFNDYSSEYVGNVFLSFLYDTWLERIRNFIDISIDKRCQCVYYILGWMTNFEFILSLLFNEYLCILMLIYEFF